MKIAVLVKQTPDTAELSRVAAEDVRSGQIKATLVINPWDEFAAEEAILLGERYGATSVAISLGQPSAVDVLKHALAMGVGAATLVDSRGLQGGDLWTTASVLAAAVQAEGADLVLTGRQSVDDNSGAVAAGVAAHLDWPLVSAVCQIVEIADNQITVERLIEGAQERIRLPLPAVLSVNKEINEPRYPSFIGIRKANKATIPVVSAASLGVAAESARTQWRNLRKPEKRPQSCHWIEGASAAEQAARLVDLLLAEKVI
ncbi:MAG: electron transfer flavoprotein subunit beta/FixA family protein [Caldilinea sp.]|nr:electron transfer flavoprotein subunit beta/FixA family protein [Caldilinea sp.]